MTPEEMVRRLGEWYVAGRIPFRDYDHAVTARINGRYEVVREIYAKACARLDAK